MIRFTDERGTKIAKKTHLPRKWCAFTMLIGECNEKRYLGKRDLGLPITDERLPERRFNVIFNQSKEHLVCFSSGERGK